MNIERAVYTYLKDYVGLKSLIGSRIYPMILPQNPTLPAVTYTKISRANERTLGSGNAWYRTRIQFSCWAGKYLDAKAVAEQIITALQSYSGTMEGLEVIDANIDNELDIYEKNAEVYHIPVDMVILHK